MAPPVQVENAYPRVVEQGGHGRVPRFGADQRLPDPDELPDMGQQPRDHRDPRRPPAIRVDGVAEGPGDVGAVRPVETRVHRVLLAGPGQRLDDADGAAPFFRYFRDYLPEFVRALPEDSEIGLVLLSGRPRMVVNFTDDHGEVLDQLARFFVEEDRAAGFFAGLEETVDRWDDDLRWPVLAVVTTDGPAQRRLTAGRYDAFIERVVERGAVIHALGLFTQRAAAGRGFQTGIAKDVTRITGGWYDTVAGPSQSIGEKLKEMAAEITRQYE